jgi:CRISPR type III-A-associated protein Csm2
MSDTPNEITPNEVPETPAPAPEPAVEIAPAPEPEAAVEVPAAAPEAATGQPRPQRDRGPREARPPREAQPQKEQRGPKPDRGQQAQQRGGERGDKGDRGPRPNPRDRDRGRDGGRGGRPEPPADIDIEKLISDSLYLDNQAHAIVARMRDMDSGTRSQLRRLYSAVRRACRATETDRQHQFVMLRARLAYTIARHQLRSLDSVERVLLQVTRKNDAKGYERFRDLFEAIIAYNE